MHADEKDGEVSGADDFMAGFNSGDKPAADAGGEAPGSEGANGEVAASADDAGEAGGTEGTGSEGGTDGGPDTGGESGGSEGVDGGENGEQGSTQGTDLNLDELPENVRQLVTQLRTERETLNSSLAETRRERDAAVGRVQPLQRQLSALQGARRTEGGGEGGDAIRSADRGVADAQADIDAAIAKFDSDEFRKYAQSWPEEAAILRDTQLASLQLIKRQREEFSSQLRQLSDTLESRISPQLDQLRSDREEAERVRQVQSLEREHPDWEELNKSDEFWRWFEGERPHLNYVDDEHMRGRLRDSSHVSHLLTRFKRESGYNPTGTAGQGSTPTPATDGAPQQRPVSGRLALAGGRPDGRQQATAPRRGTSGVTPGDDFMAGFNS